MGMAILFQKDLKQIFWYLNIFKYFGQIYSFAKIFMVWLVQYVTSPLAGSPPSGGSQSSLPAGWTTPWGRHQNIQNSHSWLLTPDSWLLTPVSRTKSSEFRLLTCAGGNYQQFADFFARLMQVLHHLKLYCTVQPVQYSTVLQSPNLPYSKRVGSPAAALLILWSS